MARRVVRQVPAIRGRARARARRHGRAISTSRSCARRRRSIRTATRCARASPRSPASRSTASASRRPPTKSSASIGRARRHRGLRDRDDPPALECAVIDDETRALPRRVLDACRARKWMVATAESCTGGLVAGALTEIAGSSDVVDRGFVTYSNAAKKAMLGVPEATLRQHGAVSRQTARGDGERRARARRGRSRGRDHRHRRSGRRHRPRSRSGWCISPPPPRTAASLHREKRYGEIGRARGAASLGDRGAHHAAGAGRLNHSLSSRPSLKRVYARLRRAMARAGIHNHGSHGTVLVVGMDPG